jgi:ribosome-binding protein aMBF1 (putative translation factor)
MLRIKVERKRRGWSQTVLAAKAAPLSASDVSRIENGRAQPYPGQLRRLARALKVPSAELLTTVDADRR